MKSKAGRRGFIVDPKTDSVAYVDGEKLRISIIAVKDATLLSNDLTYADGKSFIKALPTFTCFKAVILNICDSRSHGYPNNFEFCQAVRDKFKKLKIKYMFLAQPYFLLSSFIVGANITDINVGDTVLSVILRNQGYISTEFKFTKDGYVFTENKSGARILDPKRPHEDIRKEILGSTNPKNIILSAQTSNAPMLKTLKKALESEKLIVISDDLVALTYKTVIELYKRMLDKSDVKTYILPTSPRGYGIGLFYSGKCCRFISANDYHSLPFSETCIIPRTSYEMFMTATDGGSLEPKILQRIDLPKEAHRFAVTLFIDEEGFASYKIEPKILDQILCIPEALNKTSLQIPFISFFDSSTVICAYKEGKGYQFLDSWGGIYGKELLIAFDKHKPTFCNDAVEALRTKPSSVINDLTEILTLSSTEEIGLRQWSFKITSDAKNPVLIEFENFDGNLKAATPVFLMALLFKQHIKALENEGYEKEELKNIGLNFVIIDDIPDPEKLQRLQKSAKESCELLKIHWKNHP